MSPPQLRRQVITGAIAVCGRVFGLVRPPQAERAGALAADRSPAAGG
jgi:hypothetical protein